jgi:hypothetical protein
VTLTNLPLFERKCKRFLYQVDLAIHLRLYMSYGSMEPNYRKNLLPTILKIIDAYLRFGGAPASPFTS